jgi:hypothetical protein
MKKSRLFLAILLVCLSLASCAPVIVARTPQPAAPDEWAFSINAGYPLNDLLGLSIETPVAQPLNLFLARGVGGSTELNSTLSLSFNPSLRLGGKTLLVGEAIPVAVDYGVSLMALALNLTADAGLLVSYPQPGVEPYGALRGFMFNVAYPSGLFGVGTLTLGAAFPSGEGTYFFEVTALSPSWQGFIIVPAFGYRFYTCN